MASSKLGKEVFKKEAIIIIMMIILLMSIVMVILAAWLKPIIVFLVDSTLLGDRRVDID